MTEEAKHVKRTSNLVRARQQSIKFNGVQLFNCLPKSLRNTTNTTIDIFKSKLDIYLKSIEGSKSLSQAKLESLYRNMTATGHISPLLTNRSIEQVTFPLYLVADESVIDVTGPQAMKPTTLPH